ncbi:RT0821/Lpp0805 family surface protein [Algihabitans albus]|uniref:RT0821/Lpp0805 family surface protein n=1 Tax=Algihabitans albus TaxID=2164067 RepID=UPI0013C326B8|nr:RT0821/Lpp0805 family surface protein [Algihabitans albus]
MLQKRSGQPGRTLGFIFSVSLALTFLPTAAEAQLTSPFGRDGPPLTTADIDMMRDAARQLYQTERAIGSTAEWSNPESGNGGNVALAEKLELQGMPCRRLLHDFTIADGSRQYRYYVDRCRVPSGEWKIP